MTSLYRLDPKRQKLDPVGTTTFTALELKERGDIQEWVKAEPGILFPETGDDLLLVTSEFDGFDKTRQRLDVLAMDKGGRLVVIELKRDTSSTTAHMQVVGYAAYVSAFSFSDVADIYFGRRGHLFGVSALAGAVRRQGALGGRTQGLHREGTRR